MFNELKNAYKLVQYGLSIKKQLGFAIMFALIGIAVEIASKGSQFIGAFYVVLSGLFIYQMIISSDVSTLVQSSPYKKKIQCFYPLIAIIPWTYIAFTIVVLIHMFFTKSADAQGYREYSMNILLIGMMLFISMIYFGVSYKYFVLSTILMCVSVGVLMSAMGFISRKGSSLFDSYGLCVALAYLLLTIGSVLSGVISRLLYKKDLSKMAFKGVLGKN